MCPRLAGFIPRDLHGGFLAFSLFLSIAFPESSHRPPALNAVPMLVTTKEAHRQRAHLHATHPWWCCPLVLHCPYLSEHCTAQQRLKPRTSAVICLPLHLTPTMKSIFCSSYLLVLSALPGVSVPPPLVWISPELLISSCCALFSPGHSCHHSG